MGKNQINVALLGLGRIGQMHAENLINHKSFKLKYTFDISKKLAKNISKSKESFTEDKSIYRNFLYSLRIWSTSKLGRSL